MEVHSFPYFQRWIIGICSVISTLLSFVIWYVFGYYGLLMGVVLIVGIRWMTNEHWQDL